jgi:putative tryptophan/tyrosine transport system substrate-binding protein
MNRRNLIALLGGAAAWPVAARAQQPALPVIGYLGSTAAADAGRLRSFRQGLSDAGFIEGRNFSVEYRWGENVPGRNLEQAADLVRRNVSVIIGVSPVALAAKALTSTIPIVFWGSPDPVQVGLVASLNSPGGNVTGVIDMGTEVGGKRLSFMHELLPKVTRYALPVNRNGLIVGGPLEKDMQSVAAGLGAQVDVLTASTIAEVDSTFARLAERRIEGLFVAPGVFFVNRRVQLATLAARYAIPTMYSERSFVEVGGLISYASAEGELHRQVGIYAGRILRGEKPADLPVLRPTKFELVINAATARALGITVSSLLLAIADEVIE